MTDNQPTRASQKIVFVGSFAPAASDGTVGGQMFACRSLLNSPLSEQVEWYLIDTTQRSLPPPNVVVRLYDAARRVSKLIGLLATRPVDGVLVFSSYRTASLAEKGLMCILSHGLGKRVVISFRSEVKAQPVDRWLLWYKRWMVRSADVLICQSERAAQALVDLLGVRQDQIVVIPNWIDSAVYQRAGRTRSDVRQPVRFVYVGWLETFKGVFELLDAAHQLRQQGVSFRLVLCGSGSQQAALQARGAALGLGEQVAFRGWVDKEALVDEFADSDVFVLPSYSEGLPNALLEAMAAGLAVITTPVGGIPSVIDEPENGLLVPAQDAAALAQAMAKLAADPQRVQQMGSHNQARIRQQHDIRQVWPRVAQALNVEQPTSESLA